MNIADLKASLNMYEIGREMYRLISELYPICRSITGGGLRQTLRVIQEQIPLTIHEIPTGTRVFDWTVPKEWNIRDAYIKNSKGERVIDFNNSNLHVVSYSVPVRRKMGLDKLKEHLFTLPEYPDWIPYRTSYYKEAWGFCLTYKQFCALRDDEYEVCIDASLEEGHLSYGELYLQGQSCDEVLLVCHACHPSLCNDNLSGLSLVALLAKCLRPLSLRYSYRFLFVPATIGSITWLSTNQNQVSRIKHGLIAACVGDSGRSTYKKSRRSDAEIDKAAMHVLKHCGDDYEIIEFCPYGYDERQFCSPGFDLAVGCLTRSTHDRFPEYHTSADNLEFIKPEYLADSFGKYLSIVYVLENNRKYLNQNPHCEPQLGRRGLYRALSGQADRRSQELPMLWVLNMSDGRHTLLDIAEKSGLEFGVIKNAADLLVKHDLLKECRD
jgi:aminopeptidase-like protein